MPTASPVFPNTACFSFGPGSAKGWRVFYSFGVRGKTLLGSRWDSPILSELRKPITATRLFRCQISEAFGRATACTHSYLIIADFIHYASSDGLGLKLDHTVGAGVPSFELLKRCRKIT